jgi:hypothetical protein
VILDLAGFRCAPAVFVGDPPIGSWRPVLVALVRAQFACRPRRSAERLIGLVSFRNRILRASVDRHRMLL